MMLRWRRISTALSRYSSHFLLAPFHGKPPSAGLSTCTPQSQGRKALIAALRGNAAAQEREKMWPERGIHVIQCPDQLGIVAKISECVASRSANLLNVDLHIDFEADIPQFYARREMAAIDHGGGLRCSWRAIGSVPSLCEGAGDGPQDAHGRAGFLAGPLPGGPALQVAGGAAARGHFLHHQSAISLRLRLRLRLGSNHERLENTHVMRFLARHGIPYHFLPTSKTDKREPALLERVQGSTDFLVLARYMQVLSPFFLSNYRRDIINIHHGLLPSFKGANPYLQAYRAGVKLIGATSHFVTEELDDGPIIEQLVDRVSHRDTPPSFAQKSESLEKLCLANAVKYYCEHRILRYSGNKTLVFA